MTETFRGAPGSSTPPPVGGSPDGPEPSSEAPGGPSLALAPASVTPRRRAGVWSRLGIQSKLLAMLLGVSVVSTLATGLISYRLASTALTQAAKDKVVAVGDARLKQITAAEASLRTNTILNGTGIAQEAMRDFEAGYHALNKPASPADRAAVESYDQKVFVPNLAPHVKREVAPQAFYPRINAGWHLQAKYTAPFTDFDKAVENNDAGDRCAWSAAQAKYHSFFRNVAVQNGFEDVMLVDPDGSSVYTTYKGADLGVNLLDGAYRDSALATAIKNVFKANSVNAFAVVDYEAYAPSYNTPTISPPTPCAGSRRAEPL